MTVRPVVRYPDPRLKARAAEVPGVGDRERALAADLVDTMRASPACVGLAAPQIGRLVRAFAVDVSGHRKASTAHGLLVVFNAVVEERSNDSIAREGCLSVPHLTANVRRAGSVVVRGLDADGAAVSVSAEGFEARALLHEVDHLDGRLILDRVAATSELFPRRRYR